MSTKDFRDALGGLGPLADEWANRPKRMVDALCNAIDNLTKQADKAPIMPCAVYAAHVSREVLLGYATGDMVDIEAFYDDQKGYGLTFKEVKVQHIPTGFAKKCAALNELKAEHEKEIERINRDLKHLGG